MRISSARQLLQMIVLACNHSQKKRHTRKGTTKNNDMLRELLFSCSSLCPPHHLFYTPINASFFLYYRTLIVSSSSHMAGLFFAIKGKNTLPSVKTVSLSSSQTLHLCSILLEPTSFQKPN